MKKTSIRRVRELYKFLNPDGHWFDADTIRFFASQFYGAYQGDGSPLVYFVSSECGPEVGDTRHFYTVRSFDTVHGCIRTVGDFQAYASEPAADEVAREAALASEAVGAVQRAAVVS
jgi:hypothetical protein